MNLAYQFTLPVFVRMLNAFDGILAKTIVWAQEQGISEKEVLEMRLAPDMFPFVKQVQVACDNAKGAAARLSGIDAPQHEDTETSLAALRERIAKTIVFVESVPESAFEQALEKKITLPYFPGMYMEGLDYARGYAIGNFFFHLVTAYDLLRMKGLPIGKQDYFGGLDMLKPLEG